MSGERWAKNQEPGIWLDKVHLVEQVPIQSMYTSYHTSTACIRTRSQRLLQFISLSAVKAVLYQVSSQPHQSAWFSTFACFHLRRYSCIISWRLILSAKSAMSSISSSLAARLAGRMGARAARTMMTSRIQEKRTPVFYCCCRPRATVVVVAAHSRYTWPRLDTRDSTPVRRTRVLVYS